jgi:cytochrome P450
VRNYLVIDDLVYDPANPETLRNPHPIFAQLRAEDPVHWSEPMQAWIVTSYDLASKVLIRNETFSAERLGSVSKHLPAPAQDIAAQILRWLSHWMVFRDPPDHTRLRRHMNKVLNLPVFEALRGSIREIAVMLLDTLPRGEIVNVLPAFSIQLPGMVIMDLMGVPRDRLLEVKSWSDDMMLFIGSARGVPDKYERARRGAVSMANLFQSMIKERRAVPRDDMLSQLILSEAGGDRLNDDELIGSLMMVLNGGHETTANLINNSLLALAHHPDQFEVLRRNSGDIARAVDEFLRYDSPVLSIGRIVITETELGSKQLSPGERIFAMLVAANRDGEVFARPDELDVTRNPNPHMAFGKGHHFCLGTPLARIEGQVAIECLLERFSKIELSEPVANIPWINSMVTRGPTRLPLKLS